MRDAEGIAACHRDQIDVRRLFVGGHIHGLDGEGDGAAVGRNLWVRDAGQLEERIDVEGLLRENRRGYCEKKKD